MENNSELTIENLAPRIHRKELSPVELTRFVLDRISRLQPAVNAYLTVVGKRAIEQARTAEKEIIKGRYRGVLHGIPFSVKDLFYTRGIRTTAGSKILKRFRPAENAEAVDRLLEAGCILLGKTNLHEFAFGPTNINLHYGPVRNPWDREHISGGSSGGSAASVVSAQAIASLGTDTGGSIRIPAAACGCVGLKPSFGRVPMHGVIPLAASLDHAGPLARCVMDAAFLFEALSATSLSGLGPGRASAEMRKGIKSFRIGLPRQFFFHRVQREVRESVLACIPVFEQLGAEVLEVDLKGMEATTRLAAEITGDEALAYHWQWLAQRPQDYGRDVRIRLAQSKKNTAAAYIRALEEMKAYAGRLARVLETVHLLLTPTIPMAAPAIGQKTVNFSGAKEEIPQALLRLTRPGNLSGLPAVTLPCGFSSGGLPIGLQLIGRPADESTLLRAAYAYENATPWHRRFPPDIMAAHKTETAGRKR